MFLGHAYYALVALAIFVLLTARQDHYWRDHQNIVLRPRREVLICLGCIALLYVAGYVLHAKAEAHPGFEIGSLSDSVEAINPVDRPLAGVWNLKAKYIGKLFKNTAMFVIPVSLLLFVGSVRRRVVLFFVFAQGYVLTDSLTGLTKGLVDRYRPFAYLDPTGVAALTGAEREKFLVDIANNDIRNSFFSGDASVTAFGLLFFAFAFSRFYPSSRWKYTVWTLAATGTALGCIFRAMSGKHFPTDVLAGAFVGGAIAVGVLWFHGRRAYDQTDS